MNYFVFIFLLRHKWQKNNIIRKKAKQIVDWVGFFGFDVQFSA